MPGIAALLLIVWAVGVAYFDWRYRRIPNLLSLGAFCVGCAVLIFRQTSLTGAPWGTALLGGGFGLVATFPAYLLRKLGAGDVKYLVAMGLLTSFAITFKAFLIAATLGMCIAMLWLAIAWALPLLPKPQAQDPGRLARWLLIPAHDRRMAFGTLLSIGLVASLLVDRP